MASIFSVIENISEQLVYSSGEKRVVENFEYLHDAGVGDPMLAFTDDSSIYGIGETHYNERLALAVYHKPNYNPSRIKGILRKLNVNVPLISYPTKTIESQIATGSPISHAALYARNSYGTLGGFAMDRKSNYYLMISNNHVLANYNNCRVRDKIFDNERETVCGNLYRWVPLMLPPQVNLVDAAAATIIRGKMTEEFETPVQATARIGTRVYKIGATSDETWGTVVSTYSTVVVNYRTMGFLNFHDVLTIIGDNGEPFSEPGDSGSFVYNRNNHVVGMIFAGERKGDKSFACKIHHVVNSLSLRFD